MKNLIFTDEEITLAKRFHNYLELYPDNSLADFYESCNVEESVQISLLKMLDLSTRIYGTGEISTSDVYTFRNHPENVKRTKDYSQVCVFEVPNNIIDELELDVNDIEDVTSLLDQIVTQELKARFKYLEAFNDKPTWCRGGHLQDFNSSYILFAIHKDDMDYFAQHRFDYNLSWLEDRTSKNNQYYDRKYYPERVLAYRTWCGDVSDEMVQKVRERHQL